MTTNESSSGPPEDAATGRERRERDRALRLAPLLSLPILRFALAMQERLDANAHKGGWQDYSADALHERLIEEATELLMAIRALHPRPPQIRREAADVGNFAMMIADVAGDLHTFDAEAEIGEAMVRSGGSVRGSLRAPAPESMTPERSREITAGCVANAMGRHIPGATYQPLPSVSLEEMLVANRLCAEDKTYQRMTVDPRGLAAAYAFEHYGRSGEALLNAVGLTMEPDEDDAEDEDRGDR